MNEISEIKSVYEKHKKPKVRGEIVEEVEFDLDAVGLSPVNYKLNKQKKQNSDQATDIYNFVNISKDDAESIINLLKDYVTLKLGNGNEIKIPKLNLE